NFNAAFGTLMWRGGILPLRASFSDPAQQREKLPRHRLSLRNGRHSGKRRLVAVAFYAVTEGIDDRGPPRLIGAVLKAAVNHERMMERAFAGLQFDGDG